MSTVALPAGVLESIVEVLGTGGGLAFGTPARETHQPDSDWEVMAILPDSASDELLDLVNVGSASVRCVATAWKCFQSGEAISRKRERRSERSREAVARGRASAVWPVNGRAHLRRSRNGSRPLSSTEQHRLV